MGRKGLAPSSGQKAHRPKASSLSKRCTGGAGRDLSEEGVTAPPWRSSGPNRIPFEVDGWTQALTEEFSTLFFLYQFAIYAVCAFQLQLLVSFDSAGKQSYAFIRVTEVWFSYWHYTIIAMTIAVISGFFNTSVRLASQQSIKSMMESWLWHLQVCPHLRLVDALP